jgi:Cof subfamily protein (haloacid dehalogenase superfamily)
VNARSYDALLVDLDGTLVTDEGELQPRTVERIRAIRAAGVRVMIATGRSEAATIPVLEELGLETPAVVFNGAALWCPDERRLVEERILADRTVERVLAWTRAADALPVLVGAGRKYALRPRDEHEEAAIRYFHDLVIVEPEELPTEYVIRITAFSCVHEDSAALAADIEEAVERPIYVTHFPLNVLADHRESPLSVADVQPPCRGKAEGLRVLQERYGIPPERVVAVGDATNDIPMLREAGLGVAMRNGMSEALEVADRVIGDNNSNALAELLDELF